MPYHELRFRARQYIPEGAPVGCFEHRQRRVQISAEMVCIGAHTAQSREMLHGCPHTERFEATYISQTDIGYRRRVAGYRALTDQRIEVKSIVVCLRPQVQDQCKS